MVKAPPRPRAPRNADEIEELFLDQLEFLESSCDRFDRGKPNEYRRIATALRVLAYESRGSVSLIKQRGLDSRQYLNSARPFLVGNKLSECDLIELVFRPQRSTAATWRAVLDAGAFEFVDFQSWWTAPVMTDQISEPFSRSDIVSYVANQDGGAHVDPTIDAAFEKMRTEGFRWTDGRQVTGQPERHALRQIGHELLKSLKPAFSRKRSRDEMLVSFRGMSFKEAGTPDRTEIQGYHLTPAGNSCPCGSGDTFNNCHKLGAIQPQVLEPMSFTAKAPPDAAYARMRIMTSPEGRPRPQTPYRFGK